MLAQWISRLAFALMVGAAGAANAVQIAYDFTIAWSKAAPAFGSFALDGQVAPLGGGRVGSFAPTHFELLIDGTSITEATAIVGLADFDENGALTYIVIGNRCENFGCGVGFDGSLSWALSFTPKGSTGLPAMANGMALACDCPSFQSPGGGVIKYQDEGLVFLGHIDPPAFIPEPSESLLLVAGLALILLHRLRRPA